MRNVCPEHRALFSRARDEGLLPPRRPATSTINSESNSQLTRETAVREYTATSLEEVISRISHLSLGTVYRGVERAAFPLIPKVARFGWDVHFERRALDQFRLQGAARARPTPTSTLEWMALGQHHGLVTRLLDWTTSGLSALFFAVRRYAEPYDATVYIFEQDGAVPLHNLPKELRDNPFDWGHTYFIQVEGPQATAVPIRPGSRGNAASAYLFAPPVVSDRITAQSGVLSITAAPDRPMDDLTEDGALSRIIIPADTKPQIFQALLRCGVHEQSIFPDLDGIAAHATGLTQFAVDRGEMGLR